MVALRREEYFISHYEECFNKEFGWESSFVKKIFIYFFSRTLRLIQLQSVGIAVANSLMFFVHSATFGYGSYLVEHKLIAPVNVFQ